MQMPIFDNVNIKVQDSDLDVDSIMQFEPGHDQGPQTTEGTMHGTMRQSPMMVPKTRATDAHLSPIGTRNSQFNIQIRKSKTNLRDSPQVRVRNVPSPNSSKQSPLDVIVHPL